MKKLFLLSLFLFPLVIFAQLSGSLSIFSEQGDKFFIFLNGKKQNDTAVSSIRIAGLHDLSYTAKIIFMNSPAEIILKNNLYVSDADDVMRDATYRIRKEKSGKAKLVFYSMLPVELDFVPPAGMSVYTFTDSGSGAISGTLPSENRKKTQAPVYGSITDVRITGVETKEKSGIKKKVSADTTEQQKNAQPSKNIVPSSTDNREEVSSKKLPGNKKCTGWPMANADLASAKKKIEAAVKEDAKLQAAFEAIVSNCLLVTQVTDFCSLFKTDKSKLSFAKYAYNFTIDKKNYSQLMNVFSLDSFKKQLDKFLNGE